MRYIFTNLIGAFILNDKFEIIDEFLFKDLSEYKNKAHVLKLKEKHKTVQLENTNIANVLERLKDERYFDSLRKLNLSLTKEKIKLSVNEDNLICQAINSIHEADKAINILATRLREWYSLHNPELSQKITNNEAFSKLILNMSEIACADSYASAKSKQAISEHAQEPPHFSKAVLDKTKEELVKELDIKESMGADLNKTDVNMIFELSKRVQSLFEYRQETVNYLDFLMEGYCPNLKTVAGTTIGAKLIEHTGSLKRLVMLPASTIQILGAERALFRHLTTGAKPPRHGIILEHSLISGASNREHGKRARALADKISIAVKIDYFKGKFIGDKLKQELEEKFK